MTMLLAVAKLKTTLSALAAVAAWPSRGKGDRPGLVWSPDGRTLCIAACEVARCGHVHTLVADEPGEPFAHVAINLYAWNKMCGRSGDQVRVKPLYGEHPTNVLGLGLVFSTAPTSKRRKKGAPLQETKLLADTDSRWFSYRDGPEHELPLVLRMQTQGGTAIDVARWRSALACVLPAMSDDHRRPLINRVVVRSGWLLTTDGHRTAAARVGKAPDMHLAPELAIMLSKLPDSPATIRQHGDHLVVESQVEGVHRRLVCAAPPLATSYVYEVTTRSLWETRSGTVLSVATSDLREALTQAKQVACSLTGVKLRVSPGALHIHAGLHEHGFFDTSIDANVSRLASTLWFRLRLTYLADALDQLDAERVRVSVSTNPDDPVVLRGNGRIVVIMPVRMEPAEREPDYDEWAVAVFEEERRQQALATARARARARARASLPNL